VIEQRRQGFANANGHSDASSPPAGGREMMKRLLVLVSVLCLVSLLAVGCNTGSGGEDEMAAEEEMTQTSNDSGSASETTGAATAAPSTAGDEGLKGIGREGSALGTPSAVEEDAETPLKPLGPKGSDRLGGACGCSGY
jgi:predicted small secreted protein